MSLTESTMLELGTTAPNFALTDVVTGETVRRDDFKGKDALLIMFICVHCPFVMHLEASLGKLGADYASKSISIVAISSNDVTTHPADSPAGMKSCRPVRMDSHSPTCTMRRNLVRALIRAPAPRISFYSAKFSSWFIAANMTQAGRPTVRQSQAQDLRTAIDTVLAGKPGLQPTSDPQSAAISSGRCVETAGLAMQSEQAFRFGNPMCRAAVG